MEPRQLSAFVAVAEEGAFTRAATRRGVVQPAVSQAVRRLAFTESGPWLAVASARHPLAGGGPVALAALARDPLVLVAGEGTPRLRGSGSPTARRRPPRPGRWARSFGRLHRAGGADRGRDAPGRRTVDGVR